MTEGDGVDLNEIIASLKTDGVTLVENQLTDDQCRQASDGVEWGLYIS
jgi:hypothetical protein